MSGDYTRFTHKPQKRYSSVLMQQGRVQLDSDWNEHGEIQKRRWELQAMDVFGTCAVPEATTPNGFLISGSPSNFAIGPGRMYVDGLLAENFDQDPAVTYLNQPFYPDPPDAPSGPGTGALVYIDVWEREITYVQDRDLLEKALLGVDTATRIQTVWQVKVQPGVDCDTILDELFPPSGARVSSRAVQPPSSEDPCILPAAAGYRGPENRLYRVEIHDPGNPQDGLSSIRFKWSRENASVVSSVEVISGDRLQITVSRIGRDKVLRFKIGDRVEILDDYRELIEQAGQMRRVVDIDEANRTLTLDQPVDGDFDSGDPLRHTRVTRWDQSEPKNSLDGDGLMNGKDDWITLEDGVEIRLSLPSGKPHVGDYWSFAARTVDASVEELLEAPPRGIIHHYCHLASSEKLHDGTPNVTWIDCRHVCDPCGPGRPPGVGHQPTGAGCCVLVAPGKDIQAALDSLPDTGGCVCLKTGNHVLSTPVQIQKSNTVLHGESSGARIVGAPGVLQLLTISADNVTVQHVDFHGAAAADATGVVVFLRGCNNVTIRDCRITLSSASGAPSAAVAATAIGIERCSFVVVHTTRLELVAIGVRAKESGAIWVSSSHLTRPPPTLLALAAPDTFGILAEGTDSLGGGCLIEHNHIENFRVGVSIGRDAGPSTVASNVVVRPQSLQAVASAVLLEPLNVLKPVLHPLTWTGLDERIYAIDAASTHCVIGGNTVDLNHRSQGGIRVSGGHARVEVNALLSGIAEPSSFAEPVPLGILVSHHADGKFADDCLVRANLLRGMQDGIFVIAKGSGTRSVRVEDNCLEPSLTPTVLGQRLGIALWRTVGAVVEGNRISLATRGVSLSDGQQCRVLSNHMSDGEIGVLTYDKVPETDLEVANNVIENMEGPGIVGAMLAESARLTHNRLSRCSYLPMDNLNGVPITAPDSGIFANCSGHLAIESCEIVDTGLKGAEISASAAVGIKASAQSCQIANNRLAYSKTPVELDSSKEHRALRLRGSNQSGTFGHAIVVGNSFFGPGNPHLVEIGQVQASGQAGFEKLQFSDNHCEHLSAGLPAATTLSLGGQHLIVMSNHVKATKGVISIDFLAHDALTLMGNIATGGVKNPVNVKPASFQDFNILGP